MAENRANVFDLPTDSRRDRILGSVSEALKDIPESELDNPHFLFEDKETDDLGSSLDSEDSSAQSASADGGEKTASSEAAASPDSGASAAPTPFEKELEEMRALAAEVRAREEKVQRFYEQEYYKTQPKEEPRPTEMQRYLQEIPEDVRPLFEPIAKFAEATHQQSQIAYQNSVELQRNTALGHLRGRIDSTVQSLANAKNVDGTPMYPDFEKHVPADLIEKTYAGMAGMFRDGLVKDLNAINPQQLFADHYWKTAGPAMAKQLAEVRQVKQQEGKQAKELSKLGGVPQSSGFQQPADRKRDLSQHSNDRIGKPGFRDAIAARAKELWGR